MKFWKKITNIIKRRKAAKNHLKYLEMHRYRTNPECARPFVEAFRPKEFGNSFRIELTNGAYDAPTGLALLKGEKVIGEVRLNFLEEHGKRIVSVEAIQGKKNLESSGTDSLEEFLSWRYPEFKQLAGKTWAESLVQHALDTAYNSRKFDRFRLVTAKSQSYFAVPSVSMKDPETIRKDNDRFRGIYDWTARKVGLRKRVITGGKEYWVLDLP
jgi:hypothetical protein